MGSGIIRMHDWFFLILIFLLFLSPCHPDPCTPTQSRAVHPPRLPHLLLLSLTKIPSEVPNPKEFKWTSRMLKAFASTLVLTTPKLTFDVVLISDNPTQAAILQQADLKGILALLPLTWVLVPVPKTEDDMFIPRYELDRIPNITAYAKVLYLDVDILVVKDLNLIFDLKIEPGYLYASAEGSHRNRYFRLQPYTSEQLQLMEANGIKAFNSGTLLFVPTAGMLAHMRQLVAWMRSWVDPGEEKHFGDQAFVNAYFNPRLLSRTSVFSKLVKNGIRVPLHHTMRLKFPDRPSCVLIHISGLNIRGSKPRLMEAWRALNVVPKLPKQYPSVRSLEAGLLFPGLRVGAIGFFHAEVVWARWLPLRPAEVVVFVNDSAHRAESKLLPCGGVSSACATQCRVSSTPLSALMSDFANSTLDVMYFNGGVAPGALSLVLELAWAKVRSGGWLWGESMSYTRELVRPRSSAKRVVEVVGYGPWSAFLSSHAQPFLARTAEGSVVATRVVKPVA